MPWPKRRFVVNSIFQMVMLILKMPRLCSSNQKCRFLKSPRIRGITPQKESQIQDWYLLMGHTLQEINLAQISRSLYLQLFEEVLSTTLLELIHRLRLAHQATRLALVPEVSPHSLITAKVSQKVTLTYVTWPIQTFLEFQTRKDSKIGSICE